MRKVKLHFGLFVCILLAFVGCKNETSLYTSVPLSSVTFTKDFWKLQTEKNAETTVKDCMDKCIKSGCLHNFELAAGRVDGEYVSDNTWLDSDIYKALEAACYSMQKYPDKELLVKVDTIIGIIEQAQEKDGYLYTARTTQAKHWRVKQFMGEERWTNMGHFSHELYNMGHMIEAAVAHYQLTGSKRFLDVATKAADLIVSVFGRDGLTYPPGHQEVELALIKLYKITNNATYLETANLLLDKRGIYTNRAPYTDEFFTEYHQDHLPVVQQTKAVGHAVRAVYMYAAMADLALLQKNIPYGKALDSIWNDMLAGKIYITGGVGNQELGESFGEPFQLDNLKAYTETCAAIGLALWGERMFANEQKSEYYDVVERAIYNGILSGVSQDGTHFYYKNPLESNGDKERTEWYRCACCPPNIARYIASIGGRFYGTKGNDIYMNLYGSNTAEIQLPTGKIFLEQNTDYPWEGKVDISVQPVSSQKFTLWLRIPSWSLGEVMPGGLYSVEGQKDSGLYPEIRINNELVQYEMVNGYAKIERVWQRNDAISLMLEMEPQHIITSKIPQNKQRVAIARGPLVYCAEEIDNSNWDKLSLSLSSKIVKDTIPVYSCQQKSTSLVSLADSLHLIPYFLWANRNKGRMKVWLPYLE